MLASRLTLSFLFLLTLANARHAAAIDYAAVAERTKAAFEPITADQVEAARERLAKRAIELEGKLDPASSFGAGLARLP